MYLKPEEYLLLTAQDVMLCAQDSQERNRALNMDKLREDLDPDGISLLFFKMMHNGHEWRTMLALKVIGSMKPVEVFCDISFETMESLENRQDRIKMVLGANK